MAGGYVDGMLARATSEQLSCRRTIPHGTTDTHRVLKPASGCSQFPQGVTQGKAVAYGGVIAADSDEHLRPAASS